MFRCMTTLLIDNQLRKFLELKSGSPKLTKIALIQKFKNDVYAEYGNKASVAGGGI